MSYNQYFLLCQWAWVLMGKYVGNYNTLLNGALCPPLFFPPNIVSSSYKAYTGMVGPYQGLLGEMPWYVQKCLRQHFGVPRNGESLQTDPILQSVGTLQKTAQ